MADGSATSRHLRIARLVEQLRIESTVEAIAFSELCERFVALYVEKRRMSVRRRRQLRLDCTRLSTLFGARSVDEIGVDCEQIVYDAFPPRQSRTVAARLLWTLKQVMAWGRRKSLVTGPDELDLIHPPRGRRYEGRTTPETKAKISAALESMGGRFGRTVQDMLLLMMQIGCRPGEMAKLEWSAVSLHDKTITIQYWTEKREKERLVRLGPKAVEILRRQSTRTGLVFPGPRNGKVMVDTTWQRTWQAALKRAGLPHKPGMDGYLRPLAARHGWATTAIEKGYQYKEVAAAIGTSTRMLESHYVHINERAMAQLALDMDD